MDWNPARSAARLAAPYSIDAAFQHSRDTMSRRTQRRFTSTMPRPLKARATGLPTVATLYTGATTSPSSSAPLLYRAMCLRRMLPTSLPPHSKHKGGSGPSKA